MAEPRPDAAHLRQLDGLRGVAALFVVCHHARAHVFGPHAKAEPAGLLRYATDWLEYGHWAVDLFIVLSGFCLAIPVVRTGGLRGGAAGFLRARSWRIIPPYLAALGLGVALTSTLIGERTGTHWDFSVGWTARRLAFCLLMLPEYGRGAINYPLWSVGVEWKIYLLFPALVACARRFGPVAAAAGATALALATCPALEGTRLWPLTPWYVALFAMGVLAAWVALGVGPRWAAARRLPWGWACAAGSAGLVGLATARGVGWVYERTWEVDQAVGAAAACGLIALVARPGRAGALLAARPAVELGRVAFSIYLIHAPILQLIDQYALMRLGLAGGPRLAALAVLGCVATIAAARPFHRAFERPFHEVARGRRTPGDLARATLDALRLRRPGRPARAGGAASTPGADCG